MATYERAALVLCEATDIINELPESERRGHLKAVGVAMADIWFNLQLPIVREHRDLDPDGDRFQGHLK